MNSAGTIYTTKVRTGGAGCISACVGLLGVASLLLGVFWHFAILLIPFGLVLLLINHVMEKQKAFHCNACGNTVAPTSKLCPACGAIFGKDPEKELADEITRRENVRRNNAMMLVVGKYVAAIGGCIAAAWALLYWLLARGH